MISPLSLAAVVVLASWLVANRRTRSLGAAALVGVVALAFVLAEILLEEPFRFVVEGAAYGVGWVVAFWQPRWLRSHSASFGSIYARLDQSNQRRIAVAQRDWRQGRRTGTEVADVIGKALTSYRSLQPPDAGWRSIIDERTELLSAWRDLLRTSAPVPDSQYEELQTRERRLAQRVRELG
jgi:hypothetical protein